MEGCIREAHERYAEEIPEGRELPGGGEFEIREIDPENRFHTRFAGARLFVCR